MKKNEYMTPAIKMHAMDSENLLDNISESRYESNTENGGGELGSKENGMSYDTPWDDDENDDK
jgi:hypothetical protein